MRVAHHLVVPVYLTMILGDATLSNSFERFAVSLDQAVALIELSGEFWSG